MRTVPDLVADVMRIELIKKETRQGKFRRWKSTHRKNDGRWWDRTTGGSFHLWQRRRCGPDRSRSGQEAVCNNVRSGRPFVQLLVLTNFRAIVGFDRLDDVDLLVLGAGKERETEWPVNKNENISINEFGFQERLAL